MEQQPQQQPRRASLETRNRVLADQLSNAMNATIESQAQNLELTSEVAALTGMLGQVVAENRVLRKRLGIDENEPIALEPDEEALAGEHAVSGPESETGVPGEAPAEDSDKSKPEADQPI